MGKLDITGGDEKKIGYYAGFIVEFDFFVPSKMRREGPDAVRCRNRYFS